MGDDEKKLCLESIGLSDLSQLYAHIDQSCYLKPAATPTAPIPYEQLSNHLENLAKKNILTTSFLGDGLSLSQEAEVTAEICSLRGLTTAYTPYQPERSQGTLQTLWIYQCLMSELTGFEAVNASLYDRSTCLFEAISSAFRLGNCKQKTAWIFEGIYPGDMEVLNTQVAHTDMTFQTIAMDGQTGLTLLKTLEDKLKATGEAPAVIAFPQINSLGNIEDVDAITDFCSKHHIQSIAIIDPLLIGNNCLKPPSQYGSQGQGADLLVAEGQHLAFASMYGGPGLGIFGIRIKEDNRNNLRATPGRFIGKGKDFSGRDCKVIVLSTREQHIRREKATSNICSNQAFIATATGAALLNMGSDGFSRRAQQARGKALKTLETILRLENVDLAFPQTSFWNEVTLKISNSINLKALIELAHLEHLEIGVDVSTRLNSKHQLLKISFSDIHNDDDLKKISNFFSKNFKTNKTFPMMAPISQLYFRNAPCHWPSFAKENVVGYYQKLADQNLSPDEGIYPLGSCTMKYNPYINDWAAALPGFVKLHPQTDLKFAQGSLQILYETQEFFKEITGLKAVTTQPVAGAQGELVGLKLFQAYHASKGEADKRTLLLIPKSAHGTNPATATVAGYVADQDNILHGIKLIDADEHGLINLQQVENVCKEFGDRIAGIMITNPNTAGIFEKNFKRVADYIHEVGGLVYMDGANMNAIAGWINLSAIGVDAVHNNLHKTWTIPHGGGGPGDAIVAVSEKLVDFLPGHQVTFDGKKYDLSKPARSIGSIHRHFGNFAHKVRAYTYFKALGFIGTKEMSAVAVLSARYLFNRLKNHYPSLPLNSLSEERMHEFIITLPQTTFDQLQKLGINKSIAITRVGKLFLDFGFHAPTVAFPEPLGLMIEPTESFTLNELDHFAQVVINLGKLVEEHPEILITVPHFTPIDRADEVSANKNLILSEKISKELAPIYADRISAKKLKDMPFVELKEKILKAHQESKISL